MIAATQDHLTQALRDALDTGQTIPCGGPEWRLWISESSDDRAEAAERCRLGPCPVIAACHQAAGAGGEAYVWGGADRGNLPTKQRRGKRK